jgi:hypothetical protein
MKIKVGERMKFINLEKTIRIYLHLDATCIIVGDQSGKWKFFHGSVDDEVAQEMMRIIDLCII